jgi:hypothetical protein
MWGIQFINGKLYVSRFSDLDHFLEMGLPFPIRHASAEQTVNKDALDAISFPEIRDFMIYISNKYLSPDTDPHIFVTDDSIKMLLELHRY